MGWVWTLILNGGLWVAAVFAARDGFRQPPGAARWLAAAVLGWTWITLGLEIPGSFGGIGRGPLLAWVLAGLAASVACRAVRGRFTPKSVEESGQTWGWEGVVALGLVLWVASTHLAPAFVLPVKVVSDGPIYHLYFAVKWWKSGSLDLIASPFGENAATYFPAVGDLWFTWLIVGLGGEMLAKVGQAPFLLLAGYTTHAICRRLGAGGRATIVAVCWSVCSTPLLLFSFEPNVDTIFLAGYLLGAYFLLKYVLRDDGKGSLILCGLALGCAMGTKAVGVVFVPPLLLAGVVAAWSIEPVRSKKLVGGCAVVGAALVPSGFWFARNAWISGNPLYPLHVKAFGRVWLSGWYGPEVMPLSHYYLPRTDWRSLLDTLLAVFDARLVPFWLLAALGAWTWGRKGTGGGRVDRCVWAASVLGVLNIGLYWLVIPYRTQQRFMLQALGLLAIPLARLLDRSRWFSGLAVILLAIHFITPQGWLLSDPGKEPPWDFSKIVPNTSPGLLNIPHQPSTLLRAVSDPGSRLGLIMLTGFGLVALAAAWCWGRFARSRGPAAWLLAVLSTLLLGALHVGAVLPWDGDPRTTFYPRFPDYYRGWIETDRIAGLAGTRIAYAGTNLPYYLFGWGLRNDVDFVNVDTHRDWLLHDYHREASRRASEPVTWNHPRPGWDRLQPDYDAWLANLRAKRIALLVVTRANPVEGPHNIADIEGFPFERAWADGHPETFTLLHGPAEGDSLYRLYRVNSLNSTNPPRF